MDINDLTGVLYLDRVDLLASLGQGLLLSLIKKLQSEIVLQRRFLLLTSSHLSLRQLAGHGQFLQDLAFRLTAIRFAVPPLRDHREDIACITEALLDRIGRRYNLPAASVGCGVLSRLLQHSWPGNVCELASVLESASLNARSGIIRVGDLGLPGIPEGYETWVSQPAETIAGGKGRDQEIHKADNDLSLDNAISNHIRLVMELNRGNKLQSARQLGISRSTLYRLLGVDHPQLSPDSKHSSPTA
jgi:two-component system response regulator AtoC